MNATVSGTIRNCRTALIQAATEIQRPAEVVFGYCSDHANETEWNPAMRRVAKITDGPVGLTSHPRTPLSDKSRRSKIALEQHNGRKHETYFNLASNPVCGRRHVASSGQCVCASSQRRPISNDDLGWQGGAAGRGWTGRDLLHHHD